MDVELRELSRRAATGDREARERLIAGLLRARSLEPELWQGVGFQPHPELFRNADRLPPEPQARLHQDLQAIDPGRLRAAFPRDDQGQLRDPALLTRYEWPGVGWRDVRELVAWSGPGPLRVGLDWGRGAACPVWDWDRRHGAAITHLAAHGARVFLGTAAGDVLEETAGQRTLIARGEEPLLCLAATGAGPVWVTARAVHRVGDQWPLPLAGTSAAALDGLAQRVALTDGQALCVVELRDGRARWQLPDARTAEGSPGPRPIEALELAPWGEHLAQTGGAVLVREARSGRPLLPPVLPGRSTYSWEDNQSTMGLGRDGGGDEHWADAARALWLAANRLVTLGRRTRTLCAWTLGPHARSGETKVSYGEDTSSRERFHQRPDATGSAEALLATGPAGILVLREGAARLLDAETLRERWSAVPAGPVVSGAVQAERVLLGRLDGELEAHPLIG